MVVVAYNISEAALIEKYRRGEVQGVSTTEAQNFYYLPVRITGTGQTLRYDENNKEYFIEDRLKTAFFTPEILNSCKHLPITLGHPGGMLNSKTFRNALVIGQTVDAWIEKEEIWGLAKIYAYEFLDKIGKSISSTSPGILSFNIGKIQGVHQEAPLEINHLAFVEKGHWDQKKGGPPFKIEHNLDFNKRKEYNNVNDVLVLHESFNASVEEKGRDMENEKTLEKGKEKMKEKKDEEILEEEKKLDEKDEEILNEDEDEDEDEDEEILEEEKKLDEKDEEILEEDEDEEILEEDEDEEILEEDEEEIILNEEETKLDSARREVISQLRYLCDSAHPSLRIKMPYIQGRETTRSVILKFAKSNQNFIPDKYRTLLRSNLDATSEGLANDLLNEMQKRIQAKSNKLITKVKPSGWVDSGEGYLINQDW